VSYPNTHLRIGTPPARNGADDWHAWSQAWTQHVPLLTGRTDLTVLVAPGAAGTAGTAPECFYPDLNRIEVDATYIADSPDVTDLAKARHKRLVPTGYGLLVHGAAHAAHSRWTTPPGTPPILADVADMLEESRAEGRQRGRRRGDRRWLRHVVKTLLDPDDAAVDDAWHAGQLAGLLLARVDARIVTSKDVRAVRAAVTGVLGRKRLRQLRDIWREAHTCGDTDADTMIALARRWCQVLGIDPDQQYTPPVPDAGQFSGRLAAALVDYLAVASGVTPAEYAASLLARRHSPPSEVDPQGPDRAGTTRGPRPRRTAAAGPHPAPRTWPAALSDPTRPAPRPAGHHRRSTNRRRATADGRPVAATRPTATRETPSAPGGPGRPVRIDGPLHRGDVIRCVDLRQRGTPRRGDDHHHRVRRPHHRPGAAAQLPQAGAAHAHRHRHRHLPGSRQGRRPAPRPSPRPHPADGGRRLRRLPRRHPRRATPRHHL
jgi:hypothetical protein